MKYNNIPEIIKGLTFDGDSTDLRLHADENFRWGAKSKRNYKKVEKEIDAIEFKGNGWQIYAWYDISGFDYWMKQMQETNYVQISISFDNEDIKDSEIPKIADAFDNALSLADAIQNNYNYDPCPL